MWAEPTILPCGKWTEEIPPWTSFTHFFPSPKKMHKSPNIYYVSNVTKLPPILQGGTNLPGQKEDLSMG